MTRRARIAFAAAMVMVFAAIGFRQVVAAPSGSAFAWGANGAAQLGLGGKDQSAHGVPTAVPTLAETIAVAAGARHSLALRADGRVWSWGANDAGQLGDGTNAPHTSPALIPALSNIIAIAAGRAHSLALASDGTVWGWGANASGQLGDGTTTPHLVAVKVHVETAAVFIAAGGDHSLAIAAQQRVWAWGSNTSGQSGSGPSPRMTPGLVAISSGNNSVPLQAKAVAAGSAHSLAITPNGTVVAWGANGNGQLGIGATSTGAHPNPSVVGATPLGGGLTAKAIAGGSGHSVAVRIDGSVVAWGNNNAGQIGDGTKAPRPSPVVVPGVTGATAVTAGGTRRAARTLALLSTGVLRAWGGNDAGALGNGGSEAESLTPVPVATLTGVTAASAGDGHNLAVAQPRTPILVLVPPIGPPGFVTTAVGAGFPSGPITLVWDKGIGSVTVVQSGTFRVPILIFPNDALGERHLYPMSLPAVTAKFLVVPGVVQPRKFVGRR